MDTSARVTNRTRTLLIAALAAVGVAAVAAHAATSTDTTAASVEGHHWHGHHHGPARHFMHVLKQLNLTPEQQTQIKSIFAAAKPQFRSLGAGMRGNAEAMAAMAPTDPGYPALLATAKANAAARVQQMSDVKTQVYAVLSKTQQEQIQQIMAADKAKWQQRHQSSAPTASPAMPAASS